MGKSKQLLVVSDRSHDDVISELRIPEGWKVSYARGLQDGIDCLKDSSPLLVIADIKLSGIAEKVSNLVRERQETAFVPVLEGADTDLILKCFRAGAFDVLARPLSAAKLNELYLRIDGFAKLIRENRHYRQKLEQTNRELKDSLRILQLDQKAGKQVQQNMLPDSPASRGDYEIAFEIEPSLYLSGDFVGYNIIFDRYLLFYLADVSGHGAASAFVTILLRFILNKIIRRHVQGHEVDALRRAPEGFVEHINRQLISLEIDKHLTIFAGSIDMERHMFRYAVGAHMPAPIFMADGDARFLQGKGRPVGIFPEANWEIEEIALPEKFLLTLTSDGVLEFVHGKSLQDKMNTMLNAVTSSDGSLESICDNLNVHDLENVPDDVTVMTVRRGY